MTVFEEKTTEFMMNEQKSILIFSRGAKEKESISNSLKVQTGSLPATYLVIILSNNKSKEKDVDLLLDKINKKN